MKYKIVALGKQDAFYGQREWIIGKVGTIVSERLINPINHGGGWYSCSFDTDDLVRGLGIVGRDFEFYKVKLKGVK